MMAPLNETERVIIKKPVEEIDVNVAVHWTGAWNVAAMHAKFCKDMLHAGAGAFATFFEYALSF